MKKTLEVIFDFASPNAYLVHQALPGVLQRTGATLLITPCLLGGIFKSTGNKPPFVAFGDVPNKMAYEQKEMQRFMAAHSISRFRFNPHFPVNTLLLVRGAIAAKKMNILDAFLTAGLAAMWEQELKMDDPEVFVTAMNDAGLEGEQLLAQTQDPAVKQQLMDNTALAVQRGAFGIPTFFVGEEMFFGKERLQQVEAELLRD